jgi:probable rRNA maturation factor
VNAPVVSVSVEGLGEDAVVPFGLDESIIERVAALALERAGVDLAVELSVLITDDARLRALNRAYRRRDEVTDVLSFPQVDAPLVQAPAGELWGPPATRQATAVRQDPRNQVTRSGVVEYEDERGGQADEAAAAPGAPSLAFVAPPELPLHLGDIAIAAPMAERQAAAAGHGPAWELAYLLAHGVLHLVGYDDHTDAGYAAMVAIQGAVLEAAGIARR